MTDKEQDTFNPSARASVNILIILAAVIGAVVAFIAYDRTAAREEAAKVVAPLEARFDKHLAQVDAMTPQMLQAVRKLDQLQRNQYLICLKLNLSGCYGADPE